MIDAGLSPRETIKRLDGTGVSINDIRAVCLTHLDGDHYHTGWERAICDRKLRVFCSHGQRRKLIRHENHRLQPFVRAVDDACFEPLAGVAVRTISLRHDDDGSTGYVIEAAGRKLGYATDLGRVPPSLIEAFCGADILAIESNYDPQMQLASNRPAFLKHRIMDGWGHLSNDQAFDAVRQVFNHTQQRHGTLPSHVVLLHRSRECNCPKVVRSCFARDPRVEIRITIAEQLARTDWLTPIPRPATPGQQLAFAWQSRGESQPQIA